MWNALMIAVGIECRYQMIVDSKNGHMNKEVLLWICYCGVIFIENYVHKENILQSCSR